MSIKSRVDSFFSALTKLGGNYDKRAGARFVAGRLLDEQTLDDLYHFNDLAATICDTYPKEALREGFEFRVPDDLDLAAKVKNRCEELCVIKNVQDAAVWGRVFGDACVFLGVEDGQKQDRPLDLSKVRTIKFLEVYDCRDLEIVKYYSDPLSPKFNTPEFYRLRQITVLSGTLPNYGGSPTAMTGAGLGEVIHESRLVFFSGARTSRQMLRQNRGWHHSVLQKPYEVIRDFEMTWAGAAHLLQEAGQGVYKVKGLMEILGSEGGQEGLETRLQAIDTGRSAARSIVVDADGEDYTRTNTTFTGLPEMLDRFAGRLSAAAGIPVTRLMGEAPAGLNATGEGDARTFYDNVAAWRNDWVIPGLERILQVVLAEMLGGMTPRTALDEGTEPEWSLFWPSLYQPTEKEIAEIRKIVADTDSVYMTQGVVTPEEIALSRFGEGGWSMDTTVDLELREKITDGLTEDDIRPPTPNPNADPNAPPDPEADPKGE